MNNKYNVLVNYLGDNEFKFIINRIGEVSISRNRPIYIYNADVDTINNLRVLRRLLVEIKIGAKPDGAYKVYNLDDYNREKARLNDTRVEYDRRGFDTISNNEVNSILSSGTNGPIQIEETQVVSITPTNDVKDEEIIEGVEIVKPKKSAKKSSSKKKTSKSKK